ncbi:PQQ-binding-like beta-propeller repeat protein [Streptomyces sp. NPDC057697]|uniref:outer membrane protein assembly factor BamB family protein n=1 Tax=Streptomyces sp. NPDC057697 TaxID=3346219 RepID=UPI0036817841
MPGAAAGPVRTKGDVLMTQPPGQQPPQGGFGAPYEPQPGTYGPPPPQAAAGPYGPPAQPGPYGAPAQPGPYGSPAQPGPYGQQPQPPYGPPPQPGGPAGGGGGGFFRGRRGKVVGAVIAVALLAGGGVWLATGGSDERPTAKSSPAPGPSTDEDKGKGKKKEPGPSDLRAEADGINTLRDPGEAKVLWLQEGGVDLPRNGASVYGPWFVGDTVVKAMFHTVSGYSTADGSEKWSFRLPGKVCGAPSQATTDGKIVFGVESGNGTEAECNALQMVDLRTGSGGWYKTYKRQGTWDLLSDVAMAINGDTVTVGRTTRTDAFRVSDGKVLFGELPGNCQPFGFASGPLGIAAASCQTEADDHKEQLVERIDPVSGKVLWKYRVKKGWEVSQFYSVDPLVVSLKKEGGWAILTLDSNGRYRSQLVGGKENYRVECDAELITGGGNLDNCLGVAADERTVYLATEATESDSGSTNKVVAFDVADGRVKWRATAPAGQTMMPMRVENGRLLLFVEPSRKKGGGIAGLAPTGGTPRMLLRHPDGGVRTERTLFEPRVAYVDGRSLLMSTSISGVADGDEKRAKSMEMFGN